MKKILLVAALSIAASSVNAADFGDKYVNVNLTSANYDVEGIDDRASGFNIAFGAQFAGTNNSIEVGYANLGEADTQIFGQSIQLSASTIFVDLKSKFEINKQFSAYTKIGLNRITAEASSGSVTAEETEMKLMYGAGAAFNLTSEIDLTADYTAYAADTTALAMGVTYKF